MWEHDLYMGREIFNCQLGLADCSPPVPGFWWSVRVVRRHRMHLRGWCEVWTLWLCDDPWLRVDSKVWEKYGKSVVWVEGVAGWPFLGDLWDILDPKWMSLNKNKTEYYNYRIFKMLIGDGPAPPVEECWGTEKGLPLTSFTRSTCTRCRLGDWRTFSDSVAGVEPQKNRLKWEILAFCSRIGPEYSLI
jgi:hypothetical protein